MFLIRYIFLGFQRNAYNYIAYCHELLMPSLHEGLPYTLLVVMALGALIIASQVGGLAEVLQNDITALLILPGNSAPAQSLRRLYSDPELR
ncbi:MAG: glycosyltransferase [Candidatus Competibacteraceae bacterium]|nr:glycosyltransferase [Candidatus Competibacteraceae bacterium]